MSISVEVLWHHVRDRAGGFPPEAFLFVQEGLRFTSEKIAEDAGDDPRGSRHVSGKQLCMGLRELAIRNFGPLTRTVMSHWNIHRTEDFGRIVFILVESGLMRKSDDDRFDDFADVYDFDEAFARPVEKC